MNTKSSGRKPALARTWLALSISFLVAAAFVLASGTAHAAKSIPTEVTVGKSAILTIPLAIQRVSITDPTVADVVVISPSEIQINGKSIGSTSLIIWDKEGRKTFFDVNVAGDNALLLERISEIAPGDDVKVSVLKDMIILSGTVSSHERMFKIKQIVDDYKGGKEVKYQMVNLVEVAEVPQVLLQITVASIDRKASRALGVNWTQVGKYGQVFSSVASGAPIDTITNLIAGNQMAGSDILLTNNPNFGVIDAHNGTTYLIKALSGKGLAKILAEPNLIVKSGETGSFLAGGEFPVPIVTTSTTGSTAPVSVEYKKFGVTMNFSPVVRENGLIMLGMGKKGGISKIEKSLGGTMSSALEETTDESGIEVSSLDFANAVILSGFRIPALKKDSVSTSVELKEGESFIIAGLIREDWSKNLQKFPILGDIPILGAFFRDQSIEKTERELVFVVTPKLMKPMAVGERAELPGANEPTARQEEDLRWMPLLPTYRALDPEQLK